MACTLGAVVLPCDVQWVDEFAWLPTAQKVDVAWSGNLIVEEGKQLAGRPITLRGAIEGGKGFALPARGVIKQLYAMAAEPQPQGLPLLLEDGRTFSVLFRHHDGLAVEAAPIRHVAPHEDSDLYAFTLRLMEI